MYSGNTAGRNRYPVTVLFLFQLIFVSFAGSFCDAEGYDHSSIITSGCKTQSEQILHNGWKFFFVGDDANTEVVFFTAPDSAETVSLPHVFPCNGPDGTPLEGYGWYFRDVKVPESLAGKELILNFEGVSLYAEIFVNGRRICKSTFAYMPFSVDLTPSCDTAAYLNVAVRIDNRLRRHRIPDDKARGWWVYGGIDREVSLIVRSVNSIKSVAVRTLLGKDDIFALHCSVPSLLGYPRDSIATVITSLDGTDTLAEFAFTGSDTIVHIKDVHPWTPDDPFRYRFTFTPFAGGKAGESKVLLRGFSHLSTRKNSLILNGKPVFLRGIARHDIRELNGRPLTREQRKNDLAAIKRLGANFLRIAHFPQHRDVYELCDSIGLLVMDEIPAWKTDKRYLATDAAHRFGSAYMSDLIAMHGNFTCICIWSVGNQFKSYKTSVADYVKVVASAVKRKDPSRLVTFCSYYYLWDKAFRYVDLIAINEYFGWELASLDMLPPLLDKIHKEWPGKPVVVTELGAQAKSGLRNDEPHLAGPIKSMFRKDISEDHQALFIGAHMDTIWNKRAFVNGMVVWSYADYMSNLKKPRTPDMPYGINSCGIVSAERKEKRSFQVVKRNYHRYVNELGNVTNGLVHNQGKELNRCD
jgi:beta-galactosidase/beta-glucuronidase